MNKPCQICGSTDYDDYSERWARGMFGKPTSRYIVCGNCEIKPEKSHKTLNKDGECVQMTETELREG